MERGSDYNSKSNSWVRSVGRSLLFMTYFFKAFLTPKVLNDMKSVWEKGAWEMKVLPSHSVEFFLRPRQAAKAKGISSLSASLDMVIGPQLTLTVHPQ